MSKTQPGVVANGDDNGAPVLSATGRYVAFISAATNLVPGANSGQDQIYLKDTQTGALKLASCAADGTAGNGNCGFGTGDGVNFMSVSSDGRFVTFASTSTNLVPGAGTSGKYLVYVKDTVTGAISVVSADNGTPLSINSIDPSMTPDGTLISYTNNDAGYASGLPIGSQVYVASNEADVLWKKAVSGNWTTAANWSTSTVPISIDNVLISVPGTYTVTSAGNQTIRSLTTVANTGLNLQSGVLKVEHGTGPADQDGALAGVVNILPGAKLDIGSGTLNNTGVIFISGSSTSTAKTSFLVFDNDVNLTGAGAISLSDFSHNEIDAPNGFTNVDNTISGAGLIFGSVSNGAKGTIDANGLHGLAINDQTANPVVNDGILESTAGGGLIVAGPLTNNGQVLAKAGTVYLHGDVSGTGSATISDGAELILSGAYSSTVAFDANAIATQIGPAGPIHRNDQQPECGRHHRAVAGSPDHGAGHRFRRACTNLRFDARCHHVERQNAFAATPVRSRLQQQVLYGQHLAGRRRRPHVCRRQSAGRDRCARLGIRQPIHRLADLGLGRVEYGHPDYLLVRRHVGFCVRRSRSRIDAPAQCEDGAASVDGRKRNRGPERSGQVFCGLQPDLSTGGFGGGRQHRPVGDADDRGEPQSAGRV